MQNSICTLLNDMANITGGPKLTHLGQRYLPWDSPSLWQMPHSIINTTVFSLSKVLLFGTINDMGPSAKKDNMSTEVEKQHQ